MRDYKREQFEEVFPGERVYFCPGCNATMDDWTTPSVGCPCDTHGSGFGSLSASELDAYLASL